MSQRTALFRPLIKPRREPTMVRWLLRRVIGVFERRWNYDASYLREIVDASPRAAWRFLQATRLSNYRRDVPLEAWFAAGITAARIQVAALHLRFGRAGRREIRMAAQDLPSCDLR